MRLFRERKSRKLYGQFCKIFSAEVKELERLGYYPFQIKDMMMGCLTGSASKLDDEDREKIRTSLIKQIEFAKKTINIHN